MWLLLEKSKFHRWLAFVVHILFLLDGAVLGFLFYLNVHQQGSTHHRVSIQWDAMQPLRRMKISMSRNGKTSNIVNELYFSENKSVRRCGTYIQWNTTQPLKRMK